MLFTSFLIFLVFSTIISYSNLEGNFRPIDGHSIIINRLGVICLIFTLILFIISINIIGLMPGITLFNNWFSLTAYNLPLIFLIILLIISLLIYNTNFNKYDLKSPYYMLILISNIIGLLLFPLVNDLLSLYIVVELQSYSLYLLTGLHNRSYNASRASLLYFLMGGVASAIILLASYLIYGLTGSTNISDITVFYAYSNAFDYFDILLIALLFKMGMAPLHRWSIAVYNYAPTYITAYISVVAKISIAAWIFSNANLFNHYILITTFYLSLFIAAYKPLFQVNIKTVLAYSGLLNFGYLMLGIICYDFSFYIYIIQYVLTHVILFVGILIASEYIKSPVSKWSPLIFIHQLKLPNLSVAICLILGLFSLIGIPPLPGFYSKLYILEAALVENYVLETILLIICSVIATYYYANIIKVLIYSKTNKNIIGNSYVNPSLAYILSTGTVLLISFFLFLPSLLEGLYLITI